MGSLTLQGGGCDGFYVKRREHGEFVEAMCEMSVGHNVGPVIVG